MSQELFYRGAVIRVDPAMVYQRNLAPILARVLYSSPIEIAANVESCCKSKCEVGRHTLGSVEFNTMQVASDSKNVTEQSADLIQGLKLKVAAISTLVQSQESLVVSDSKVVGEKIQRIVEAKTVSETKAQIHDAFHEIKSQHKQVMVSSVTEAVKESSIAVGFNEVKVMSQEQDMVRVIATNKVGQNLIAEIDSKKQIDIRTELIGYTDGSCKRVINAFEEELSKRGVSSHGREQKATNGIPQMEYAKKLIKPKRTIRLFMDEESTIQENENSNIATLKL